MNTLYINTLYVNGLKKYLLHFLKKDELANADTAWVETSWETGYDTENKTDYVWVHFETLLHPDIEWLELLARRYPKLDFALDFTSPANNETGLYIASGKGLILVEETYYEDKDLEKH